MYSLVARRYLLECWTELHSQHLGVTVMIHHSDTLTVARERSKACEMDAAGNGEMPTSDVGLNILWMYADSTCTYTRSSINCVSHFWPQPLAFLLQHKRGTYPMVNSTRGPRACRDVVNNSGCFHSTFFYGAVRFSSVTRTPTASYDFGFCKANRTATQDPKISKSTAPHPKRSILAATHRKIVNYKKYHRNTSNSTGRESVVKVF